MTEGPESKKYKITISNEGGDQIKFEEMVNRDQLRGIMQIVLSPGSQAQPQGLPDDQQVSPREHLEKSGAKSNPEKFVALASYLKQTLMKGLISPDDIRVELERAGEPNPSNFFRDFKRAIRYGWISASPREQGKFYITNKGEEAIKRNFTGQEVVSTSRRKSGRKLDKTRFVPTRIRDEVSKLALGPESEVYGSYHNKKTKTDRILWILAEAKRLGIPKLNQKEITFLSEILGGGTIEQKAISPLLEGYRKKSFVGTPLESGVRYVEALNKGLDYLKVKK